MLQDGLSDKWKPSSPARTRAHGGGRFKGMVAGLFAVLSS
jgi:hypothetical protein